MNKYQEAFANVKRACIIPFLGRKPIDVCGVSLDRLKELVERATPKKLDYEGDGYADGQLVYDTAICPNCERYFEVDYDEHSKHCPSCGQALDWSEEE